MSHQSSNFTEKLLKPPITSDWKQLLVALSSEPQYVIRPGVCLEQCSLYKTQLERDWRKVLPVLNRNTWFYSERCDDGWYINGAKYIGLSSKALITLQMFRAQKNVTEAFVWRMLLMARYSVRQVWGMGFKTLFCDSISTLFEAYWPL